MMKYVFVLVLLHLCVSAKSDTNLYKEIIGRLMKLKDNVTTESVVKAPVIRTSLKPHKCLGVIKKELGNLLDNVTVPNNVENIIQELKGNLNALGDHEVKVSCNVRAQKLEGAFRQYITFFRRLNTRG